MGFVYIVKCEWPRTREVFYRVGKTDRAIRTRASEHARGKVRSTMHAMRIGLACKRSSRPRKEEMELQKLGHAKRGEWYEKHLYFTMTNENELVLAKKNSPTTWM